MDDGESDSLRHGCSVIEVDTDRLGRWLVQDTTGRIGGLFLNRKTALDFAKAECDIHHGSLQLARSALVAPAQR